MLLLFIYCCCHHHGIIVVVADGVNVDLLICLLLLLLSFMGGCLFRFPSPTSPPLRASGYHTGPDHYLQESWRRKILVRTQPRGNLLCSSHPSVSCICVCNLQFEKKFSPWSFCLQGMIYQRWPIP